MKLPRNVSGAEAVRALERPGFRVVRQVRSHVRLAKGGVGCTVPMHDSIAPGTLQSILRQSGVSVAEFVETL